MNCKDYELGIKQLRRRTDPATLGFKSTEETLPLEHIIGQERAVRAIDFGIHMPGNKYHIVVVGPPGSGRTSVVKQFLDAQARSRPCPNEWCYVHNFDDPGRPRALRAPAGRAAILRREMKELVSRIKEDIPRTLEGELYEQRRREITLEYQNKQQALLEELQKSVNERGFALIQSQMGLHIAPVVDGKALTSEQYDQLDPEARQRLESHRPELTEQFDKTMRITRQLDRERRRALQQITYELIGFVVDQLMADTRAQFQDCPKILEYLDAVRRDLVAHADEYMPQQAAQPSLIPDPRAIRDEWSKRYQINVLSSSNPEGCAPVVVEDNPTYQNLIGRIEHRAEFGAMLTDFTHIRAGALHRANGGYLIVEAKDLLSNPLAWHGLKRALHNQEIKIEEIAQFYGLVSTVRLEPEPIPLDVKVVIIAEEWLYQALNTADEDFRDQFKVKAEFHTTMPRTPDTTQDLTRFIGDTCRRQGLRHFDAPAVARIVEEASRLADDQEKLTTRLAVIQEIVEQGAFWAAQAKHALVTAEDVDRAVGERRYRLAHIAERYADRIEEGVVLINTTGSVVGQVNGLSVLQLPHFAFGIPSRVTARTFAGKAGVVSIDREVKMSGPIHDKGQLILSAWLASRFAQERPLTMSATLTFEQSYSGIEGDSASSTELYALLSSLSGIPLKQNLAVTGSINQAGEIQAIGGVNAKVEGFFDVCKRRGLTGDQGVLMPAANVRHLMLRQDIVEAADQGQFHVYAVSTVEEGIELLTDTPVGEPDEDGHYPENSVFGKVHARLAEYAARSEKRPREAEPEPTFASTQRSDVDAVEPTDAADTE